MHDRPGRRHRCLVLIALVAALGCGDDGDPEFEMPIGTGSGDGDGDGDDAGDDGDGDDGDDGDGDDGDGGDDDGDDDDDGGDADSTGDDGTPTLSHDADIQPIWDSYCVDVCHEAGGEWALLDMTPGNAYDAIVEAVGNQNQLMNLVEPGDPDASYLWAKLNGTQVEAGGSGVDMPKARAGEEAGILTTAELETIEAWIAQGAPP